MGRRSAARERAGEHKEIRRDTQESRLPRATLHRTRSRRPEAAVRGHRARGQVLAGLPRGLTHSSISWDGSGRNVDASSPTRITENATAAAVKEYFAGNDSPGMNGCAASVLVTAANAVPIIRPPMFAATLSPVPRRCTG